MAIGSLCLLLADLSDRGFRVLEYGMMGAVVLVGGAGFLEWLLARTPSFPWAMKDMLMPYLPAGSMWMALALFGATVMPHAIFLQSAVVLPCRASWGPPVSGGSGLPEVSAWGLWWRP